MSPPKLRIPEHLWPRFKKRMRRMLKRIDRMLSRASRVPDRPVLPAELFPFLAPIEADWKKIRDELEALLTIRDDLPKVYEIQRDNTRISEDGNWTTFVLRGFGTDLPDSAAMCPETWRLVQQIPRLESAYFSILAPGANVPPHKGLTKAVLRAHLGLVVPEKPVDCFMMVAEEPCNWEEGRFLVFDDTRRHSVVNRTDQNRVVLLVDFERPMAWYGRLLARALLFGVRRTRFVRDGHRAYRQREPRIIELLKARSA